MPQIRQSSLPVSLGVGPLLLGMLEGVTEGGAMSSMESSLLLLGIVGEVNWIWCMPFVMELIMFNLV